MEVDACAYFLEQRINNQLTNNYIREQYLGDFGIDTYSMQQQAPFLEWSFTDALLPNNILLFLLLCSCLYASWIAHGRSTNRPWKVEMLFGRSMVGPWTVQKFHGQSMDVPRAVP